MTLQVVKAEEVRDGEPRWWTRETDVASAVADSNEEGIGNTQHLLRYGMHTDSVLAGTGEEDDGRWNAIVNRPSSAPVTNEHTPEATRGEVAWQEMVWRQAFNAFLSAVPATTWTDTVDQSIAASCGDMADACLAEWKKRWQR